MTRMGAHKRSAVIDGNENNWWFHQHQQERLTGAEEDYLRIGGLVVISDLLLEMGVDPAVILSRVGIETSALNDVETRIPYVSMGRSFHECALATVCPHFDLLAYQRVRFSHLAVPGELMRYSATLRAGLQGLVVYQHLNNQGMAACLFEDRGIGSLGCGVFQNRAEFVDQIYDAYLAVACDVMRDLWGCRSPKLHPAEIASAATCPPQMILA